MKRLIFLWVTLWLLLFPLGEIFGNKKKKRTDINFDQYKFQLNFSLQKANPILNRMFDFDFISEDILDRSFYLSNLIIS